MATRKTDQIRERILADIENGVYAPGELLPTRHELMAAYGVARATIDRVVRSLCDTGILVSTRGSGTYVATATNRQAATLYIVLNTDVPCIAEGLMEREWNFIVNDAGIREQCIILGCHEIDRFLPAILTNPHARVIWNRPAMRSHAAIAALHKAGRHQVLVNRSIPRYNFVSTDVREGIERALLHVADTYPHPSVGMLPPYINPETHYLAEREIHFFQAATRIGLRVMPIPRTDTLDHGGTLKIVGEAIRQRPDVLYIPDHYMTPYAVSLMQERSVQFGEDMPLITSDWNEAPATTPGLICLKQQWRAMFQEAVSWALQERPGRIRRRIEIEMDVNP